MATISTNFYLRKPVNFTVTSVPELNTDNWSIKTIAANSGYVSASKLTNTTFCLVCNNPANTSSKVDLTIGFEDNGTPNYIAERNISFQWSGTYLDIYESFYVLVNNQWVVPSSGITIKVGDVDAVYQGNGLWFVSLDDVDATAQVYVNGTSFGTFGKEIYTDGSELTPVTYNGTMPSGVSPDKVSIKNIQLESLPCYIKSVTTSGGNYANSGYQSVGLNNSPLTNNSYSNNSFPCTQRLVQVNGRYLSYTGNAYNDTYAYLVIGTENNASSGWGPPTYKAVVNYVSYPPFPDDSETI